MKNNILLCIAACFILLGQSCVKDESLQLPTASKGTNLLSNVNTYYNNHVVIDSFYYKSNELWRIARWENDRVYIIYFEDKRLKESRVAINENGKQVSYYINYLNDGSLSLSNDDNAYIMSDLYEGLYSRSTSMIRGEFNEWITDKIIEYNWYDGNLVGTVIDQEVENYTYDSNPNPLAGYIAWGFFFDELFIGTKNNRLREDYNYEYNNHNFPVRLNTPDYHREYFYY